MDGLLDNTKTVLIYAGKLLLFVALSSVFIPSYLVMTYLQETWSGMLKDLFNL